MLTVIIPTRESERTLVQTLSPLVAGATAGLIAEVIVADGGSRDATEQVAEIAGCRFVRSDGPVGARLKDAAALARTAWLLFLRAGSVPEPGWVDAVEDFMRGGERAAAFARSGGRRLVELFGPRVRAEQGLLIPKRLYERFGGHNAREDAEAALLRKVRPLLLAATVRPPIT
jgi:glycosyltransferase involved in cell wall biosynthesis